MAKQSKLYILAIVLVIVFLVVFLLSGSRPKIGSIHVINLDKDKKRWESIQKVQLSIPIERWRAVYGKDLSLVEMSKLGIGRAMTMSGKGDYVQQAKDRRNLGQAGCFLSHRTLLEHLASMNVSSNFGHLVLEDDSAIPSTLLDHTFEEIPSDWDIVYLSITAPKGTRISPKVMKLHHSLKGASSDRDLGNYGTHAYLIRHGAIQSKVLPWMRYMIDSIDGQFEMKFDEWKVYAYVPGLLSLDPVLRADSSIQEG